VRKIKNHAALSRSLTATHENLTKSLKPPTRPHTAASQHRFILPVNSPEGPFPPRTARDNPRNPASATAPQLDHQPCSAQTAIPRGPATAALVPPRRIRTSGPPRVQSRDMAHAALLVQRSHRLCPARPSRGWPVNDLNRTTDDLPKDLHHTARLIDLGDPKVRAECFHRAIAARAQANGVRPPAPSIGPAPPQRQVSCAGLRPRPTTHNPQSCPTLPGGSWEVQTHTMRSSTAHPHPARFDHFRRQSALPASASNTPSSSTPKPVSLDSRRWHPPETPRKVRMASPCRRISRSIVATLAGLSTPTLPSVRGPRSARCNPPSVRAKLQCCVPTSLSSSLCFPFRANSSPTPQSNCARAALRGHAREAVRTNLHLCSWGSMYLIPVFFAASSSSVFSGRPISSYCLESPLILFFSVCRQMDSSFSRNFLALSSSPPLSAIIFALPNASSCFFFFFFFFFFLLSWVLLTLDSCARTHSALLLVSVS